MNDNIKRLRELQEKKLRKVRLESLREELTTQQRELSEICLRLKNEVVSEHKDVEQLKKPGVKSLLFSLIGKKEKKLEQEQREVREAQLKYENAVREQQNVENRLCTVEAELSELEKYTAEYDFLRKKLLMEINDAETLQRVSALNDRIYKISEVKNEIKQVLEHMESVRNHLKEAERWASAVQIAGGEAEERSMYHELDLARRAMGHLQVQIEQLQLQLTELGVKEEISFSANIVSGFKNRMLSGTAVIQMVKHVYGQNYITKVKLQSVLEQLDVLQRKTEEQLDNCFMELIR